MIQLDKCLELTRKIKELDQRIEEREARVTAPKCQIITGMPRGGPCEDRIDDYIIMTDRLRDKKKEAERERDRLWDEVIEIFKVQNIKADYMHLMFLRFYHGFKWDKCCTLMKAYCPNGGWNINKVFRVYRKILGKNR